MAQVGIKLTIILKIFSYSSFAPSAPRERSTLFQDHGRFQS